MIALALIAVIAQGKGVPERIPAIFRCPAIEGESELFARVAKESMFDSVCIDPKPGPLAVQTAKGNVKFVPAEKIDTKANLAWRDATLDFVNGKLSPKAWLKKIKGLRETVHFLSSPKTQKLREATGAITRRAVFGEMLLLTLPGRPCFTSDDIGQSRYLPDPGAHQSWVLAMNDYRGPMMYIRALNYHMNTDMPTIVRADSKPGLLILRTVYKGRSETFYFNNGPDKIEIPLNPEKATISIGVDYEGTKPKMWPNGFVREAAD